MSWFQLDPNSVLERVRASGKPARIPSLRNSLAHGMVGFTLLSISGFAPWAIAGRWFYRNLGELGLYITCALVFIALSAPLLRGLMIGPGTLARFYKLFTPAFVAYSVLWIVGWMTLRGHLGSVAGLFAGTAAMGWILARAFGSNDVAKIIAALFLLNSVGYFVGGWAEGAVMEMKALSLSGTVLPRPSQAMFAKLLWGVFYGMGLGAGLGWAFYLCQSRTRAALNASERVAG